MCGTPWAVRTRVAVRESAAGAAAADVIVLAVKPQQMREAVKPLLPLAASTLVVSIAAGIRLADLSRWLGGHAAVVRATTAAAADVLGAAPSVEGMTYGADMRLLVNDGGIPTVLFGPGDVRRAHGPDECVPVHDLIVVTRALALAAVRFCGVAD